MPRTIERTVFKFSELSERAKNKARDDARYSDVDHSDWWDCTFEDAVTVAALMGIKIDSANRGSGIHFSGFCSQGDGASFTGHYNYRANSVADVVAHAPQDEELKAIAEALAVEQTTTWLKCGGHLYAHITISNSSYCHSGTMDCSTSFVDVPDGAPDMSPDQDKDLLALFRHFADWIYAQLEAEHDYLTSDEHLDECLSEEEFDEDGSMI